MADFQAKLQEEKILRAIRAKRRFKAAVRHVIYNISWLQDYDDEGGIDPANVKQAVDRLTRKKKSAKGLTIKEKAILRKHLDYRTEEEKKHLNKHIGGLKCFRRYPENVQLELVAVTYFEYYGAGRVLVKQNQEAHAMYFLLTGDVVVTRTQWDEISNEYVEVELAKIGAGSMFGEVSLLHNVLRTATVTSSAPCELLVLKKVDFDRVLKTSLMQRWDDIRDAMTKFMYFDQWNNVAIRECCILSRIKSYLPNQVVFGDGRTRKGAPVTSYFLIEGKCAIVEHLFVEETYKRGIKFYKLYKTQDSVNVDLPRTFSQKLDDDDDDDDDDTRGENLDEKLIDRSSRIDDRYEEKADPRSSLKSGDNLENMIRRSVVSLVETQAQMPSKSEDRNRGISYASQESRGSHGRRRSDKMSIMSYKEFLQKEMQAKDEHYSHGQSKLPPNVKIRFMQICTLYPTSTFIEGELMKNRRVIAITPSRFLLIPSYWLIQHNRANMWTRVEHYLNQRIPSRQAVFKAYVNNRKWQEHKIKLRNDILAQRKFPNNTTIHDVPYSIRVKSNYE